MRVVEIGFALCSIAFVAHGQPAFAILVDEFDQLDPNHWEAIGGTWTADDGVLSGEWSIFAAQTDQGNLLSRDLLTNQDFAAEFRNGTTGYPGQRFVLYESPGNKYNVVFQPFGLGPGQVGVLVELRLGGNTYTPVLPWTLYDYDCAGPAACTFGLVKAGSRYSLFINGSLAGEFTDSIWSGNTRLGLGAYAGPVTYDRFTLETVPIPEPGILVLLALGLSGLGAATRVRRGRAPRSAGLPARPE